MAHGNGARVSKRDRRFKCPREKVDADLEAEVLSLADANEPVDEIVRRVVVLRERKLRRIEGRH